MAGAVPTSSVCMGCKRREFESRHPASILADQVVMGGLTAAAGLGQTLGVDSAHSDPRCRACLEAGHCCRTGRFRVAAASPGCRLLRYTRAVMYRFTVLLVMLLAILWQSVALARVGSTVNVIPDLEHAALHWQGQGHHHHDDGSHHMDDSNESAQHVLSDHVSATAALMVASSRDFPPMGSAAPGGVHKALVPDPTLAGLLRPPRSRA
jgi:hypothetical protein